jgi:hypothetical protein
MGCKRLKTILIPSSVLVDWYSYNVFEGCDSLESAVILCPTVYTWFKKSKSLKKVILGNTVKTINGEAFYLCENLESIDIPNSVQEIKYCVFSYCKKLTSVYLPNSLSYIAGALFENCTLLKHVNIPYNAELIGSRAFKKCVNLKTIDLPNSVTEIGEGAFASNKLTENVFIYNRNNDGTENKKSINSYAGAATEVVIPNNVEEIGPWSFYNTGITSLVLNEGLKYIRNSVFYDTNLTSITIPSTVEEINEKAFNKTSSSNPGLTSIVNKTGKSFNWGSITNATNKNQTFIEGDVVHTVGTIYVTQ